MSEEFELIFSIGGFCQVAYQIEQRFGFRISSPFDWLVTPLTSVEKILNDDGIKFGDAIHVVNDGKLAICSSYGVAYHHDYPKDESGIIHISAELVAASRSKMLHKYSKFSSLIEGGKRTLFVRLGGHHDCAIPWPYIVDPRPVTTEDLNALCAAIGRRFPRLPFEIAFVTLKGMTTLSINEEILDPRVRLFEIAEYDPDWAGLTSAWAPIFDQFKFKLDGAPADRLFVGVVNSSEQLL